MRIAFYAPLKAVDHPVPSGDRTMARALVKALADAGHDVEPVSKLRTFLAAPDPAAQARIAGEATVEAERIARLWRDGAPPKAWITYHNHYKAPDLLGPTLSRRFGLPFLVAEASHATRREAAWRTWYAAATTATCAADAHICFTARDRRGLEPLLAPQTLLVDLPPFIDPEGLDATRPPASRGGPIRLATVAMMRPGDKLASYAVLAAALAAVRAPWHLDVVGDGPAREDVERLFAVFRDERVTWHGTLDRTTTWRRLRHADLFVWPGLGEAFGLAYLEAQCIGLPVLALDVAGVSAVVADGRTGWLVGDPSAQAFAEALNALASDRETLARTGAAAQAFVRAERTIERASAILDQALQQCVERKSRYHE